MEPANDDIKESGTRLLALRGSLLAGYQAEELHQLRVTLRRMRSVLRNVPTTNAQQLRADLGAIAALTNAARDWDTLVVSAQEQLQRAQSQALLPFLQARQEVAHAEVYRMFHSHLWLTAIGRWDAFADKAVLAGQGLAAAPRELRNRLRHAREAGRKALAGHSDKRWHKLRIAIKELRYSLESLPAATGEGKAADLLMLCKSMQAQLGEWHDSVIHRHLLTVLAAKELPEETQASSAAGALARALELKGQHSLAQIVPGIDALERYQSISATRKKGAGKDSC